MKSRTTTIAWRIANRLVHGNGSTFYGLYDTSHEIVFWCPRVPAADTNLIACIRGVTLVGISLVQLQVVSPGLRNWAVFGLTSKVRPAIRSRGMVLLNMFSYLPAGMDARPPAFGSPLAESIGLRDRKSAKIAVSYFVGMLAACAREADIEIWNVNIVILALAGFIL